MHASCKPVLQRGHPEIVDRATEMICRVVKTMKRRNQLLLIIATLVGSWYGMQAVHELGHVLGAIVTGAEVKRIVLHPLSISRTDIGLNPNPSIVVWAGPIVGAILPVLVWGALQSMAIRVAYLARFFAGFCCVANGAYIAFGSFDQVGDCKEMLDHGSPIWSLWLFGAVTVPLGLWLWHGQGHHFGLGSVPRNASAAGFKVPGPTGEIPSRGSKLAPQPVDSSQ